MFLRELEEGNLERATIMDRVASRALQVGAWACSEGGADAQGSTWQWDQAGWYPRELIPFASYPYSKPGQTQVKSLSQSVLLWHFSGTQGLRVRAGYPGQHRWPQIPSQETRVSGGATRGA